MSSIQLEKKGEGTISGLHKVHKTSSRPGTRVQSPATRAQIDRDCASERAQQNRVRSDTTNSTLSIATCLSNNPFTHVNQESFNQKLHEQMSRYSMISESGWQNSGSSFTINDPKNTNLSGDWAARQSSGGFAKDDYLSPKHALSSKEKSGGGANSAGSWTPSSPAISETTMKYVTLNSTPLGSSMIKFSTQHEILFIMNVCLAQLLSLACLAQTVSPLLRIASSLGLSRPGQLAWLTAAYSMSLGAFIVPAGRLGDMFGHKKIFLLGFLWLALWSFFCGFSYRWGFVVFCICRGFQGIGPALLVPNGIALIARVFPPGDKRALVIGIFGACGPCGFLTGAAFAGMFAELISWRWAFFATAIACIIISCISYLVIPDQLAVPAAPPGQEIPTFDWGGCITGVAGLLLINFSLNEAPLVGWSKPYVYFMLIIGIMFTSAFVLIEMHVVKDPLLPVRGLQPQAWLTLGCIAAGWASHGIWLYYYFLFQMRERGLSSTHATLQLVWVGPIGIFWAMSTGIFIKRFHVSRVMLMAMTFFCAGTTLLASAPPKQTYWALTFLSVLITPGGMNLSFPAGCLLLSNAMPREHQGKAASLVSTVVNYSIASGLGFAGTVDSSIAHHGGSQLQRYRGAWDLAIGFAGLGILISIYFIWTAREQISDARKARKSGEISDGALDVQGQKKIFSISTANLQRPAPAWATRLVSRGYGGR